jgi:hypothetical protein
MKDPAFLYYDGDAAKDVSHMNRLERGCYFDLIQAQRKFRGFTVEQARKILGKDFSECWDAITLILECENDVYFIPWVRESLLKRAEFKEIQRERIQNYWDKKNNPELNRGNSTDIPSENEIVNEYSLLDYNTITNILLKEESWISVICMNYKLNEKQVANYLNRYINDQRVSKPGNRTLVDVRNHFNNWLRIKQENAVTRPPLKQITEESIKREREERLKNWKPLEE